MLDQAAQRATALNRPVHLAQMNLLQLDFPDRSFDTLVATFVLPCLPETLQGAALRELRRVCKPKGVILLLDYKLSRHVPIRVLTRCLSPWLRFAFGGPLRRPHGGPFVRLGVASEIPALAPGRCGRLV